MNRFETFALAAGGALLASHWINGLWWLGFVLAGGSFAIRKYVLPHFS